MAGRSAAKCRATLDAFNAATWQNPPQDDAALEVWLAEHSRLFKRWMSATFSEEWEEEKARRAGLDISLFPDAWAERA